MTKIKISLNGMNNRMETKEKISELKDGRAIEIIQICAIQREKILKDW